MDLTDTRACPDGCGRRTLDPSTTPLVEDLLDELARCFARATTVGDVVAFAKTGDLLLRLRLQAILLGIARPDPTRPGVKQSPGTQHEPR